MNFLQFWNGCSTWLNFCKTQKLSPTVSEKHVYLFLPTCKLVVHHIVSVLYDLNTAGGARPCWSPLPTARRWGVPLENSSLNSVFVPLKWVSHLSEFSTVLKWIFHLLTSDMFLLWSKQYLIMARVLASIPGREPQACRYITLYRSCSLVGELAVREWVSH